MLTSPPAPPHVSHHVSPLPEPHDFQCFFSCVHVPNRRVPAPVGKRKGTEMGEDRERNEERTVCGQRDDMHNILAHKKRQR